MTRTLADLPPELVLWIAAHIEPSADLAALASTSRCYHTLVNPVLYKSSAATPEKHALFWGAASGQLRTVRLALEAGIDPSLRWWSSTPRIELSSFLPGTHVAEDAQRPSWVSENSSSLPSSIPPASSVPGQEQLVPTRRGCLYFCTAAHIAAHSGDVDILNTLLGDNPGALASATAQNFCSCGPPKALAYKSFPGARVAPHWTPLHVAICKGNFGAAKLLLSKGSSLYVDAGQHKITALHAACQFGLLSLAKFIIGNGYLPGVDALDDAGQTPLVWAYLYRQWDCFDYLLQKGANINMPVWEKGVSWMLLDALESKNYSTACKLVDNGSFIYTAYPAPLLEAIGMIVNHPWRGPGNGSSHISQDGEPIAERALVLLRKLVGKIEDWKAVYETYAQDNRSPVLHAATEKGNTDAVQVLLEGGHKVDLPFSRERLTALHCACADNAGYEKAATIRVLLAAGANVDLVDAYGETPLHHLCKGHSSKDSLESMELLIQHGAHPMKRSRATTPRSAIEAAAFSRNSAAFELILRMNPDPSNWRGYLDNAFEAICQYPSVGCLKKLLECDEANDIVGSETAIVRLLVHPGSPLEAVRLLLEKGAPSSSWCLTTLTRSYAAMTCPLLAALKHDDSKSCIDLLLEHRADVHTLCPGGAEPGEYKTPLISVIRSQNTQASATMIQRQPLKDSRHPAVHPTLTAALQAGDFAVVSALLLSPCGDELLSSSGELASDCLDVVLTSLSDSIHDTEDSGAMQWGLRVNTMDGMVDSMALLVSKGAVWSHGAGTMLGISLFDKLTSLGASTAAKEETGQEQGRWFTTSSPTADLAAGIAFCLQERITTGPLVKSARGTWMTPQVTISQRRITDAGLSGGEEVKALGMRIRGGRGAPVTAPLGLSIRGRSSLY